MNQQLLLQQLDKRRSAHGITIRDFSSALNYANKTGWYNAVRTGQTTDERLVRADAVLDHYEEHGDLPDPAYAAVCPDEVEQYRIDSGVTCQSLSIVAGYTSDKAWDTVIRRDNTTPSDERTARAAWALDYRDHHGILPLPHETLVAVLP